MIREIVLDRKQREGAREIKIKREREGEREREREERKSYRKMGERQS